MTLSGAASRNRSSSWTKIRLLLWKNFILQKRNKWQTIINICLPILFFLLFSYVKKATESKVSPMYFPQERTYQPSNLNYIPISRRFTNSVPIDQNRLLYSPNTTLFRTLMSEVTKSLKLDGAEGVEANQIENLFKERNPIAAVEFHNSDDLTELPKKLSYSIRFPGTLRYGREENWKTNVLFSKSAFDFLPIEPKSNVDSPVSYYNEGFLAIQHHITNAFIKQTNSSAVIPDIQLERIPYPAFSFDGFLKLLISASPFLLLVCFCYNFVTSVRFVASEKEKQLKEAMEIMGLPMWIHWFSWFGRTILIFSISMASITVILTVRCFGATKPSFSYSNPICIFIFFICYSICITMYSFLMSALFSTVKTATTVSTIAWFLSFLPYYFTNDNIHEFSGWLKIVCCLFPNSGMAYGIQLIVRLEEAQLGLDWSTFFEVFYIYDPLSVTSICLLFLLTALLFFGLVLYLGHVLPGAYGIAKPWNFLFKRDFWQQKQVESHQPNVDKGGSKNFEREPLNRYAGIEARNLSKVFGAKTVVDNLSMNMYENQITVLLGHNGAGKTTTISMLIGMIEPNSGTAVINGHDIRTNTDGARGSIGFCPQHNILFDDLTVREHIVLYSQLKGLNSNDAENEVHKYAALLELQDKINAPSKSLSGGQQRKLSVGIALCGRSKVVFLDEPTSGMDVNARRALWDVLLAEKENRTILLTTHFMDEADVLGDRIAIMAEGELRCCGSSFFLKKRFGSGYHLICAKDLKCNSSKVTNSLRRFLPGIHIENENDSEIFYELPNNRVHIFEEIFKHLEDNEKSLGLKGFGVSLSTLEEIFLKFAKHSEAITKLQLTRSGTNTNSVRHQSKDICMQLEYGENLLHGCRLIKSQISAMFRKRFLCSLRAWKTFVIYNFFVSIFVILFTFDLSFGIGRSNLPPLQLSFDVFRDPYVLVQQVPSSSETTISGRILNQLRADVGSNSKINLLTTSNNIRREFLKLANESMKKYNEQYLTGATATNAKSIIAFFNNQAFHTSAMALNLIHNAVLKVVLGLDYGTIVTNAPFKYWDMPNNKTENADSSMEKGLSSTFSYILTIVIGFYAAHFVRFYVTEKACKSRLLQYISGANKLILWTSSIAWDLLQCIVTTLLILSILACSQHYGYSSFIDLMQMFSILFLFHTAMLPFICLISLAFSNPTAASNAIGMGSIIIVLFKDADILFDFIPKTLKSVLNVYPVCALLDAQIHFRRFKRLEIQWDSIFSWESPAVGEDLTYMSCTGIVSFCILIAIEMGVFKFLISLVMKLVPRKLPKQSSEYIDDDVAEEKSRIDAMTADDLKLETIAMQNVSKFYGRFLAVNQVSLAIKRSECFGLLGSNGAGKTTIFKMLTGELSPSIGEIYANGFNQKTDLNQIYKNIGYCPQFDALLNNLTCRETLEIFAKINGIPNGNVNNYTLCIARDLDFLQHIDKRVSQLSGGNKRKLSTAIGLMGDPSIVFLDEPTTGMDPATKRNLWNLVIKLRESGKSIILTSHSMEECEALCTRLTVLVNGNIKCLGSVQHLKNKFTKGFELKIKMKPSSGDSLQLSGIKKFIMQNFNGAKLMEEYQGVLTYSVPAENVKWSRVFGIVEDAKTRMNIEDYSISQNSLEQVVLSFIKNQNSRQNEVVNNL